MLFFEIWNLASAREYLSFGCNLKPAKGQKWGLCNPVKLLVWLLRAFPKPVSLRKPSFLQSHRPTRSQWAQSHCFRLLLRPHAFHQHPSVSYILNPTSCLVAKPLAEAVLSFSVELSTTLTEAAATCFSPSKRVKITGTSCRKWNFNSSTPFLHFCCDSQAGINSV